MHEMQLDHDPDIAQFGTWNLTPQVAYSPHLAPRKTNRPIWQLLIKSPQLAHSNKSPHLAPMTTTTCMLCFN
jgi:hypothetical protein